MTDTERIVRAVLKRLIWRRARHGAATWPRLDAATVRAIQLTAFKTRTDVR